MTKKTIRQGFALYPRPHVRHGTVCGHMMTVVYYLDRVEQTAGEPPHLYVRAAASFRSPKEEKDSVLEGRKRALKRLEPGQMGAVMLKFRLHDLLGPRQHQGSLVVEGWFDTVVKRTDPWYWAKYGIPDALRPFCHEIREGKRPWDTVDTANTTPPPPRLGLQDAPGPSAPLREWKSWVYRALDTQEYQFRRAFFYGKAYGMGHERLTQILGQPRGSGKGT